MKIEVPYGNRNLAVEIPEDRVMAVVSPNEVPKTDFREILTKSLENPVDSSPFDEFINHNTLFIVNDGTRPTPTAPILEYIDTEYDLKKYNPEFMVATGAHRSPTEDEFSFIFGRLLGKYRNQIHVHEAKRSNCVYLGKTSTGTEVYLNKKVLDAKRLVIITSVEPHYFAGFTGGRKSILPGISGYRTIGQNHTMYDQPGAEILNLDGNPVHTDMLETLKFLDDKEIFTINTVLNKDHRLYYLQSGDIHKSFKQAVAKAKEVFAVSIPQKTDIVITVATYPMDVDLYQAQKALENGKYALRDDGIIILVAQCREGIGDPTFLNLLSSSSDPRASLKKIEKGYKLGYHKAAKVAQLAVQAEIWGFTDLEYDLVKKAHIHACGDLQQAVDEALERKKGEIIVLLDGSITVPMLS